MNKKAQVSDIFYKEFVIVFGFLNGLWAAVGINPEAEIFRAFKDVIDVLNPGMGISFLFTLVPIIILVSTILLIFFLGGWMGIAAVGCGFIGGLLIITSPIIAFFFLIIGGFLGFVATND